MNRWVYIILLLLCSSVFAFGQTRDDTDLSLSDHAREVAERNAAQGFNDTIDRLAEDFVTVSLVVSEPGEVLYSVLGHACLHLQCPTFGLDYIFTYESEGVRGKVFRFLLNDLNMGMMSLYMNDYLQPYKEEGRGVKEYRLNLPPEVKSELWRMCDERVGQGMYLEYDPVKRGCAISVVHSVEDAIRSANEMTGNNYQIVYPEWGNKSNRTIREIFYDNAAKGWGLFWCMTMVSGRYVDNPDIPEEEKLIAPFELVERWQVATINGLPIISEEPIELAPSQKQYNGEWFSPLVFALLLFVLSIIGMFTKNSYLDYAFLSLYTIFSLLITYMLVFPSMPNTDWNWLIIPFNILPAICWKWRKKWALPYVIVIALWCICMLCAPHRLVEYTHIILATSFGIILLKQKYINR